MSSSGTPDPLPRFLQLTRILPKTHNAGKA